MESDDGTVACIAPHVVQYLFRAHPFTIITSHKIPHNDAVMMAQGIILPEPHVPDPAYTKYERFLGEYTMKYSYGNAPREVSVNLKSLKFYYGLFTDLLENGGTTAGNGLAAVIDLVWLKVEDE